MTGSPRKHLYRLNSLVVLLVAVGCALYALSLPMGNVANPGAGMWPFTVSIVMGLCALILLVTERDSSDYEPLSKRTWIIVAGFGLMAAFIVAFVAVGLTLSCLALTFVWLRWMAKESWLMTISLSLVFTALFVVGFGVLLAVPMPDDIVLSLILGKGL